MRTHFVHAADIHLGYEQYNLLERANDFALAYLGMVDYAIEHAADFVMIAGDLFHRASADAWMLKQANAGLESLRRAGIPVVAIEGNHDSQHMRKHLSWMEFLCQQELLYLLNVKTEPNGYRALMPWDNEERSGSWLDIGGTRIYGIKYYGALTGRIIEEIVDQIEPAAYTIFMLHAGIQGQVPHLHGGLTVGQLARLHPPVDYLALGHVHQRLTGLEGWIYNPGSTETNSMEEFEWSHGFFDVAVDTDRPEPTMVTPIETSTLRPFRRLSVNADDTGTLEHFIALVEEKISAARDIPPKAVVELHLGGVAAFRRQDVPIDRFKGAIQLRFSPLTVRVRNNLVPPGLVSVRHGERLKRTELERKVVEQLVYQQGEYRDRAAAWTKLVLDVKNMAADRDLPASIADHVRSALAAPPVVLEPAAEPEGDLLPEGGESPCMAHLLEEW